MLISFRIILIIGMILFYFSSKTHTEPYQINAYFACFKIFGVILFLSFLGRIIDLCIDAVRFFTTWSY